MRLILSFFAVFFITSTMLSLSTIVNGEYGLISSTSYIFIPFALQGIGYCIIWAKWDSEVLIKGIHYKRELGKVVMLSFLPVILWIQQGDMRNLWLILYGAIFFKFSFDIWYNYFRGHPPFYIGTEAASDRIVRFINKNTIMMHLYPYWMILGKLAIGTILFYISIHYYLHG